MLEKNIVLIGMPGAGKSTIGIQLAKALKKPFIDTDFVVQKREGALLQDILNSKGLKAFLITEEAAVMSLDLKNHVIATGGSVVYSRDAMYHLKKCSTVIYLQLNYRHIGKRVRNITTRGIAMNKGQTLFDIYKERAPLYKKYADITVNCSGKRMEKIVAEIVERLA